jgi:hypothetical protein
LSRRAGCGRPDRCRKLTDAKTERDKRLAAALRDNLRRRKAAAAELAEPAERHGETQKDRDQG